MLTYAQSARELETMMLAYLETIESPAGPLTFAVDDAGRLIRISFLDGHYPRTIEQELRDEGYTLAEDDRRTEHVRQQLREYSAGTRMEFDLPLALVGSEWQCTVWNALLEVPFGETWSYGQIAAAVGQSGSARAVGRANGTNRIPLVIPCHRVIGADGSLTGFGGGMHLKVRLLEHERRVLGIPETPRTLAMPIPL